ncbi:MAG: MliC family protein [Halanaerobium sp.]|nr:MliC family protein [Halanaerobium sp.]
MFIINSFYLKRAAAIIGLLAIVGLGVFFANTYLRDDEAQKAFTFVSEFNVRFLEEQDAMELSFAEGETFLLPRVISASGARYSNGEITFWNKGDQATINIKGVTFLTWLEE